MDVPIAAAGAVLALMVSLWVASLALKDASIVDMFWGPGFVLVAGVTVVVGGPSPTKLVVASMVAVWGLRLGYHISSRNIGGGEDPRYVAMRRRAGRRFWWRSLITVFLLQGGLMLVVSSPVLAAMADVDGPGVLSLVPGGLVWAIGLVLEATGDAQLRRFKADPSNAGKVMDRGLWRYTRHPNYFGDSVVWWGLWITSLQTRLGWAAVVGPLAMSFLLMRVSGVPMLERRMARTKPGYREYMERTSAFIPRRPKREPSSGSPA